MKKTLTNNLGIKILSLFIAVLVWFTVVSISDPVTTTKFYDIPVTFENEEAMTKAGLVYSVVDGTDLVKVTVTAPRSVLSSLDKNSFDIVADLSRRKSDNTVPLTCNIYNSDIENITLGHDDVIIQVEELVTRQIAVELSTVGVPKEGYAVGEVIAEPDVVTVSGPASFMETVEKLKATVDISDCFETLQSNCKVEMVDAKGETLVRDRVTFSDEDIMVTANFLPTKTVDLKFSTTGAAAPGYAALEIESEPAVITICGQSQDIANISVIEVPAEELDITDLDKSLTKTINVEQYLPENVKILSADAGNIKVTASIKKVEEKIIEYPVSNITVKNLKTGYSYSFVNDNLETVNTVSIKVYGLKSVIEELTIKDIKVTVDVAELKSGTQHVKAQITTPTDSVTEETWLQINLKR